MDFVEQVGGFGLFFRGEGFVAVEQGVKGWAGWEAQKQKVGLVGALRE